MTVYTVANTAMVGRPVRVYDREGVEIKQVTWCDSESGLVRRWDPAFPCGTTIVEELRLAPLLIVWR